jgi:hypothetical protein
MNPGALGGATGARNANDADRSPESSAGAEIVQFPRRKLWIDDPAFLEQWTARLPGGGFVGAYRTSDAIWSAVALPGDPRTWIRTFRTYASARRCAEHTLSVAKGGWK